MSDEYIQIELNKCAWTVAQQLFEKLNSIDDVIQNFTQAQQLFIMAHFLVLNSK